MSNLFAALGWTLVDLVLRPDVAARVAAGEDAACSSAAPWSRPGWPSARSCCATCSPRSPSPPAPTTGTCRSSRARPSPRSCPLTNTSAAPGLDRWDPDRWRGRRLAPDAGLATPELVTAFGHGSHTCPAQPFSLAVITRTVARLLAAYDLVARFSEAAPLPAQVGGVARAADPCPLQPPRRP